jgi:phosphoribosylaminoimidazole carboxylase PurE protein
VSAAVVSVLMGSANDDDFLKPAYEVFESFGIPFEKRVLSAHRQPAKLAQYLGEAKHVRVFLAAAGYSAALPGVVAAHTIRPVIGIPVPAGPLKGVDALLSIAQMPGGIPVAAVAVGSPGPKNAALLAAEILALADEALAKKLLDYRKELNEAPTTV